MVLCGLTAGVTPLLLLNIALHVPTPPEPQYRHCVQVRRHSSDAPLVTHASLNLFFQKKVPMQHSLV